MVSGYKSTCTQDGIYIFIYMSCMIFHSNTPQSEITLFIYLFYMYHCDIIQTHAVHVRETDEIAYQNQYPWLH